MKGLRLRKRKDRRKGRMEGRAGGNEKRRDDYKDGEWRGKGTEERR